MLKLLFVCSKSATSVPSSYWSRHNAVCVWVWELARSTRKDWKKKNEGDGEEPRKMFALRVAKWKETTNVEHLEGSWPTTCSSTAPPDLQMSNAKVRDCKTFIVRYGENLRAENFPLSPCIFQMCHYILQWLFWSFIAASYLILRRKFSIERIYFGLEQNIICLAFY